MDIYEIVSGKEAKKMEKDRIVNFIELDPTIILFPIRIVKKDLSSFSVFELKCKSFDCEKYYLGEYLSQGILFFSDKQRNFKNIYQSYYKESDKSMFSVPTKVQSSIYRAAHAHFRKVHWL